MKKWLPFVLIAVVAVVTIGIGVYLYRTNLSRVKNLTKEQAAALAKEAVHVRGYGKAAVTIEEFGDFECPPCGRLSEPLNKVERDFAGKVRIIFRHLPLAVHPNAAPAAYAAEAAGRQGHFWEMHDLLYRQQEIWSKVPAPEGLFVGYAKTLGLDPAKFRQDMQSKEVKERVASDQKRAAKLGVTVTPTVFLNGKSLTGPALGGEGVHNAVAAALAEIPAQP